MKKLGLGAMVDFATAADAEGMREAVLAIQTPALGASITPSIRPTLSM